MSNNREMYDTPMQAWPGLSKFGKKIPILDGDLDIFFYEIGKDHPHNLVMIHGLGDEADTWRHVLLPLAKRYHIIAVDLPGFGRSDLPESKITPVFLMGFLKSIWEATGLDRAILLGNSLGAILSHAFALKNPDLVEGLVLVGGALLQNETMGDISLFLMQIPLLGEWLYTRLRKDPQAAYDSLRNVYFKLDNLPESDRDFLFTRVNQRVWSDKQRKAYFSTLRNLSPWVRDCQANLPEQLSLLQIPTLVLRGEHDNLFLAKNGKGVERVQPKAVFSEVPDSGHLPHQENPEAFLKILEHWLAENIPLNEQGRSAVS